MTVTLSMYYSKREQDLVSEDTFVSNLHVSSEKSCHIVDIEIQIDWIQWSLDLASSIGLSGYVCWVW